MANKLKTKMDLTAAQAAEFVSALALGISQGEVNVDDEEGPNYFHPGPMVSVSVEGKEDLNRGEVSIKIAWKSDLRVSGGSDLWVGETEAPAETK